MTYSEWREANVHYVLVDDEGDVYAEVCLPNHTLEKREGIIGAMAASSRTRWTEATQYNHEG
jgi:hypothetical protein